MLWVVQCILLGLDQIGKWGDCRPCALLLLVDPHAWWAAVQGFVEFFGFSVESDLTPWPLVPVSINVPMICWCIVCDQCFFLFFNVIVGRSTPGVDRFSPRKPQSCRVQLQP